MTQRNEWHGKEPGERKVVLDILRFPFTGCRGHPCRRKRETHRGFHYNYSAMRIRPRFFFGVGLIAAAIGYLIFSAIRTTSEYYLTVPEVAARQTELGGQAIRVAGRVKPGNIAWEPKSITLKY